MKGFASYIIGVAMTLTLFDSADAELAFRSNSKVLLPNPTSVAITPKPSATIYQPTSKNSINTTSKGIQLHFREYPLGEILKNIQEETGVFFSLSPQIAKNLINIDIEAKHWKSSVQKLIADYSRIELWTNQTKTSQIWLVENTPYN